jgi:hypothetical protein
MIPHLKSSAPLGARVVVMTVGHVEVDVVVVVLVVIVMVVVVV